MPDDGPAVGLHHKIDRCDMFILYTPLGPEAGMYRTAKDCANAIVTAEHPERMMVRGLAKGREAFRMNAIDFGMTIYD